MRNLQKEQGAKIARRCDKKWDLVKRNGHKKEEKDVPYEKLKKEA